MSSDAEHRRIQEESQQLFREIRNNLVREAAHLRRTHDSLDELLEYANLSEEFDDDSGAVAAWCERLTLALVDVHCDADRPLLRSFRARVLEEEQDHCAPRPLYWGETRPQQANVAPCLSENGLSYHCNIAVLDQSDEPVKLIGNWVLAFEGDVPDTHPAPAIGMTLKSMYLLPDWQGLGVGSAVNKFISRLVCRVLSSPLEEKMPDNLPAPPAIQFDSEYITRDGERLGRQICSMLEPLAREHGMLFFNSSSLTQQGTARRDMV